MSIWPYRINRITTSNCNVWLDRESGADLAGGGAGGYAARHGWFVGHCATELSHAPCAGAAFIFRNRAGNRLRVAVGRQWRLAVSAAFASGPFVWPKVGDAVFALSQAQWQWLIAGVDWQRLSAQPSAEWQV
jgi:transposase